MLPGKKSILKWAGVVVILLSILALSARWFFSLGSAAAGSDQQPAAMKTFLPERQTPAPASPIPTGSQPEGRLAARTAAALFLLCGTMGMLFAGVLIAVILGRLKVRRPPS